ncbi:MAG: YgiQ family radical SAM protein [Calditerrivibrio sp.]|nr:YgiQ family radical SAM protein [Calditerrivibrio sp.]
MFLPINRSDMKKLGWNELDIIFVSGDTYIDSPYCGVALLGKWLLQNGFKVGIISQPDINSEKDIISLGTPKLFWGVTAGCVDSMVANYTPLLKKRRSDDFTPGGVNNKRPDRATIVYTNLIKKYDKLKKPIIIGGIEASLRRIAHYDYWDNKIRRSILFDAKADILIYGMAELTLLEIAKKISEGKTFLDTKGICYINKEPIFDYIPLPAYEEVANDKTKFIEMFHTFYQNNDPLTAKGLYQKHGDRYLIHNPPQRLLTQKELDELYEMEFEHNIHPEIRKLGKVKALDTVKFSVTINRGCYGECNFCAITVHQGTRVISRSRDSIIREISNITKLKHFDGIIRDVGGPTANMYNMECYKKMTKGKCINKRCIFPEVCKSINIKHNLLLKLFEDLRKIPGVKKLFVASGIRYDLVLKDKKYGLRYLEEIIKYHTSGQMKIAPEHIDEYVLDLMGKPSKPPFKNFVNIFYNTCKKNKLNYYLTYYFIAAHPGCNLEKMKKLKDLLKKNCISPDQTQIFTPLPSTYSAVMYWTEKNPWTLEEIYVEKSLKGKKMQKVIIYQELY